MTDTQARDQAAEAYKLMIRSACGSYSVYFAFIAGADWQREHQDDYDAFNGRLGPSDDAWRETLQATINQQAEEIEALRTSTEKLRRMLVVNMAERDELRAKCAVFETRLIDMTKIATGAA